MVDLDLNFPPVAPNSATPEQAVNTGFDKVKAALTALNEALSDGGSGLPPDGAVGQFLAILAGGTAGWVNPPSGGGGGAGGVSNAGPHEWWRIVVTKSNTDQRYCNVAELGLLLTADGVTQTTGGTPIESDHYAANVVANAFDGDVASIWECLGRGDLATTPAWVGYHFAAPVEVNFVKINVSVIENDEWPTRFNLEYSDNGTDWSEAFKVPEFAWVGTSAQFKVFDIRIKAYPVPVGGTIGQVLTKLSGVDGDFAWATPTGGGTSPGVGSTYWRLLFPEGSSGAGNNYMRIAGVEFRKVAGVAEAHAGTGTIIVTPGANDPGSNVFDGDATTYWDVGFETAVGAFVGLNFTASRAVKEVAIQIASVASYGPKSFKLQNSVDGTAWVDVYTSTSPIVWAANELKTFTIP